MTRFAWLTPGYPPDRGGVSDHSGAMVRALREQGHEVLVKSRPQHGFDEVSATLDSYRPEAIVVAYTPLGYAAHTGGISPSFALWSRRLRRRHGVSTLLLAHEVNLPVIAHWQRWEFKFALLGAAQIVQFEILARSFDRVVFSNQGTFERWAARLPHLCGKLRIMRICSNIPLVVTPDSRAELERTGYSVAPKTVLFFGSAHPSILFDYVEAALVELLKVDPRVQLAVIGVDSKKLLDLRPSLARFGGSVQALGYIPDRAVSLWLQVAELVLAPLSEGVSARKGTVMAAFQHGRVVVTTRGIHTRGDIAWDFICALAPMQKEAFAATTVAYFQDSRKSALLGQTAKLEYEYNASAAVTAARLATFLTDQRDQRPPR